jgi:transcriptional regulator of acetoin/glycerol metabolism
MLAYDWPGNVRELENMLERACVLSGTRPVLHLADFPSELRATTSPGLRASGASMMTMADLEKEAIRSAIDRTGGNKVRAAKLLGIGKTTLYRKVREYGIDSPQRRVKRA